LVDESAIGFPRFQKQKNPVFERSFSLGFPEASKDESVYALVPHAVHADRSSETPAEKARKQ
jgi:hypothetical protein